MSVNMYALQIPLIITQKYLLQTSWINQIKYVSDDWGLMRWQWEGCRTGKATNRSPLRQFEPIRLCSVIRSAIYYFEEDNICKNKFDLS